MVTDRRQGAIGVDLNADHLAVTETDASGNYLNAWREPLVTYRNAAASHSMMAGLRIPTVPAVATTGTS